MGALENAWSILEEALRVLDKCEKLGFFHLHSSVKEIVSAQATRSTDAALVVLEESRVALNMALKFPAIMRGKYIKVANLVSKSYNTCIWNGEAHKGWTVTFYTYKYQQQLHKTTHICNHLLDGTGTLLIKIANPLEYVACRARWIQECRKVRTLLPSKCVSCGKTIWGLSVLRYWNITARRNPLFKPWMYQDTKLKR